MAEGFEPSAKNRTPSAEGLAEGHPRLISSGKTGLGGTPRGPRLIFPLGKKFFCRRLKEHPSKHTVGAGDWSRRWR